MLLGANHPAKDRPVDGVIDEIPSPVFPFWATSNPGTMVLRLSWVFRQIDDKTLVPGD